MDDWIGLNRLPVCPKHVLADVTKHGKKSAKNPFHLLAIRDVSILYGTIFHIPFSILDLYKKEFLSLTHRTNNGSIT